MIWAALATAIMLLSGEGDDSKAIRDYYAATRLGLKQVVRDAARLKQAEQALDDFYNTFVQHRVQLASVGKCLEEVDRRYQISEKDYERCGATLDQIWQHMEDSVIRNRAAIHSSMTEEERIQLSQALKEEK